MDVGNPKQAAALGVIALGALGYLGMRLIGPMFERTTKNLAASDRKAPATSSAIHAAYLPVSDPFSHPKLAIAVQTNEPGSDPTMPVRPAGPHGVLSGEIPSGALPSGTVSSGDVPSGPLPAVGGQDPIEVHIVNAAKPAEGAKDSPQKSPTTIGLEAIVSASDPVAFLVVDGKSSEPFHLNQSVSGPIRLEKIGDGAVVLKCPKGRLTLGVGEQKRL